MCLACVGLLGIVSIAEGVQYSFLNITNNNSGDAAIGEAQIFLDVTDYGPGQVLFTYSNIGPAPSSITDIYVDDGTLVDVDTILNQSGTVEFALYPTPGNLPGGENLDPPFVADSCLSADSDPPPAFLGINPYESLGIIYNINGGTFADVIYELDNDLLRIGIHVQDFDSEGSESFINPEPATLSLLALGSLAILRQRRRR